MKKFTKESTSNEIVELIAKLVNESSNEDIVDVLAKLVNMKESSQEENLKVGDHVKFIKSFYENDVGKIAVINEIDYDDAEFNVGLEGGGWADFSCIVKITPEEYTELEKWTKIGRKPGEYKKGDIVRVIDGSNSSQENGNIGEIAQVDNDDTPYRVNSIGITSGNFLRGDNIELITPVESRFDLAQGDVK